jgi:hypothetical protein
MKATLIFFLLLTSFGLYAQTGTRTEVDSIGPNSALNIPQQRLEAMCDCARKQVSKLYKSLDFLTPFEERILIREGYREAQILNLFNTNRNQLFEIIRTSWNEKWSKVYCIDNSSMDGYLDMLMLYSFQHETLKNLYDSNGNIKANMNRLVSKDPYQKVTKSNALTIRDLLEHVIEREKGDLLYSLKLERDLELLNKLTRWGAKRAVDLTPVELELELSRARKEGTWKE